MTNPVALEYKRGNAFFTQRFRLFQNGQPFDLTKVAGNLSIIWWFLEASPGAVKKSIPYLTIDTPPLPAPQITNRVTFRIPSGFFNVATDYNSDIEVFNDQSFILSTKPSFIVSIKEVAGIHTDP